MSTSGSRTSETAAAPAEGTIAVGDCIELMNGWPAESVDLVFADPPYNIGFEYDRYEDDRDDDDYVNWTRHWIEASVRVLKPTGSMFVLIGDEYAAETRLILKDLEKEGRLLFRNWIIWHYTFGQNCRAKFNRSHAHLFYAVGSAAVRAKRPRDGGVEYVPDFKASDPPFAFNRDAIAVPSARQTTYGDSRANPDGKLPDDTWYLRPQNAEGDFFRPEEDTWYLSRLCGTFKEREGWHPCQLPESLLERIVQLASNPDDLVLDPFAGSGTTLAVAQRLGRQWVGCELSEDYAERALERVERVGEEG
ncbi:MAG: site-specific DNA-methyltransferase [Phycisphaeraceae bacterium]|nr:site-specific DNA-methyltransferase [Phycisphaeraceae bacterium]